MFSYQAYNTIIHSTFEIPGFDSATQAPDLIIEERLLESTSALQDEGTAIDVSPGSITITIADLGRFAIRTDGKIVIDKLPTAQESTIRRYLTGPIFGVYLHQRGYLVLHATTVRIGDDGIAFLGPPGTGKSTLAAACLEHGFSMVSDDITAVYFDDDWPMVVPGPPLLKLKSETTENIEIPFERVSISPGHKEVARIPGDRSSLTSYELTRLYTITEANSSSIEQLSVSEAMKQLVGHTYVSALLKNHDSLSTHFEQCTALIDCIPVNRLNRPKEFEALPEVVELIERDIEDG